MRLHRLFVSFLSEAQVHSYLILSVQICSNNLAKKNRPEINHVILDNVPAFVCCMKPILNTSYSAFVQPAYFLLMRYKF